MKKLFILALASFIAFSISAQINASSWVLMGGAGYFQNTNKSESPNFNSEVSTRSGVLDFGGMYLFTDNIGGGLTLNSSGGTNYSGDNKASSWNTFGATLLGRYYSPCMAPRFYFFGQADISFAGGSQKNYDDDGNEIADDKENLSVFGFGIRPGISYFLTPAIMLEASFGALAWSQTTNTLDSDNRFKQTSSNLEFFAFSKTLQFGFCWWLGRSGQGF